MWKAIRRWWKYLGAKLSGKLEESADPKVQLEQAIEESQQQHRRLTEQAANVIANQKQTQMRLERAVDEYEKSNASARQALLLADEANRDGKSDKVASYKQAVAQNAAALQKKLTERQKLLSQLDQAKMQEQMNTAMSTLSATVGEDVPTFEQVRDKIERRLAKAQGMSDLTSTNVDTKMLEVEQAQASAEAQARLSELRSELGLTSPETEKPAPAPQPAEAEKPAEKPSS